MEDHGHPPDQAARDLCLKTVVGVFPDICPEYLESVAAGLKYQASRVLSALADHLEVGQQYKKRPRLRALKRKREEEDDIGDEVRAARRKYCEPNRLELTPSQDPDFVKVLLTQDFPSVPVRKIRTILSANLDRLAPTYLELADRVNDWNDDNPPWQPLKRPTAVHRVWNREHLANTIAGMGSSSGPAREAMEELQAARLINDARNRKRKQEETTKKAEQKNYDDAMARDALVECQCCFVECPINRTIHCSGNEEHLFCGDCARKNAETQVGLSKYEIFCMSMDGCTAQIPQGERHKFLDAKLAKALDNIEQEAMLRLADIAGLARCPFCPYAAEYPPIEVNHEFQCENPECRILSCRKCNQESHVPKTCEEVRKENGVSARREIEEAMTAAMIRKCNKCKTPFIKEMGCNKMTCTRQGCRNIQCYICSKSCDYTHFNDTRYGGKGGNCPLFESVENRHSKEIADAEEKARKSVAEKHPGLDLELLKFNMSKNVSEDDERRRQRDPYVVRERRPENRHQGIPVQPAVPAPPAIPPPMVFPPQAAAVLPPAPPNLPMAVNDHRYHNPFFANIMHPVRALHERVRAARHAFWAPNMARHHGEQNVQADNQQPQVPGPQQQAQEAADAEQVRRTMEQLQHSMVAREQQRQAHVNMLFQQNDQPVMQQMPQYQQYQQDMMQQMQQVQQQWPRPFMGVDAGVAPGNIANAPQGHPYNPYYVPPAQPFGNMVPFAPQRIPVPNGWNPPVMMAFPAPNGAFAAPAVPGNSQPQEFGHLQQREQHNMPAAAQL